MIMSEVIFKPMFNNTTQFVHDWRKCDHERMKKCFDVEWAEVLTGEDVQADWCTLSTKIHSALEECVPKIRRRQNNRPPWMTQKGVQLARKKRKSWIRYTNLNSAESYKTYQTDLKKAKKQHQRDKRNFEKKLSESGNKKPFNSYIKSKTKSRSSIGPLKDDGKTINDDFEMAQLLNKFFTSVFTHENTNEIPSMPALPSRSEINDIEINPSLVEKKINAMKNSSASGPDDISVTLLKNFSKELSVPLSIIFKKSMDRGELPSDWKLGNITPIFKKGSKKKAENYRPISITCVACRLLESIIKDQIVEHLAVNNLIKATQHGFMKNKSTVTNLIEFFDKITSEVDAGTPMDLVYLDFSKAFDKVPRERLLAKLEAHKIHGKPLAWIRSWLTGRQQRVVINGKCSAWELVDSGVPQGSVLGPLCFIIFLNHDFDLLCEMITIINKFADDSKLGNKAVTREDQITLQRCLDSLYAWTEKWGMQFNVEKCKIIHTGAKNRQFEYTSNGKNLQAVKSEKDLGVMMQSNLKPSLHCAQIARTANGILGRLLRSFHYRDRHIYIQLYKQYVRCHLEYGSPAWSPWQQKDIDVIERVQRRAVRQVSGLRSQSYEGRLIELGLESLQERRNRADQIQVFKTIRGIDNVNPDSWFQRVDINSRTTRYTSYHLNLEQQRSNLEIRKNFFTVRAITEWNNLPAEAREAKDVRKFKLMYDKNKKN